MKKNLPKKIELISPFPPTSLSGFYKWSQRQTTIASQLDYNTFIKVYSEALNNAYKSYAICGDGEVLGIWIVEPVSFPTKPPHDCNLTIGLDRKLWGRNIYQTFTPYILDDMFKNNPTVLRVTSVIPATNWLERHLAKDLGSTEEGCMRDGLIINGKVVDAIIYGMTKKDFYGTLRRT